MLLLYEKIFLYIGIGRIIEKPIRKVMYRGFGPRAPVPTQGVPYFSKASGPDS